MMLAAAASIPSDPTNIAAIGWWCVIACTVAFGINQVWELVNRARGDAPHPPNGELQSEQKEIKRRVKVLEDWKDSLIRKLDEDKRDIMKAGEDREKNLGDKIHLVGTRVDSIQKAMAELPNEFMALLANAKHLLGGDR